MEIAVRDSNEDLLYEILLNLIVPRPIAWVSTVSASGIRNLAPFSFFNAVSDSPPVFMLSISDRDDGTQKDTVRNILETGEFVINIVSEDLLEKMKISSGEFPPEVDEFEVAGLTPEDSKIVKAPRVKEAKAAFECKLLEHRKIYEMNLILGEAVHIKIEDEVFAKGKIDLNKLKPVGRVGTSGYIRISSERASRQ